MGQKGDLKIAILRQINRYPSPDRSGPVREARDHPEGQKLVRNVPNGQIYRRRSSEGRNCPRQTLNIIFDLKVAAAPVLSNFEKCFFGRFQEKDEVRPWPSWASVGAWIGNRVHLRNTRRAWPTFQCNCQDKIN